MLVLSRKVGERVLVGNDVIVTLVRIGQNAVRLGIEAPKEMNIVRGELIQPIQPIQASESDIADLGRRVIDPLGVAGVYEEWELK